jgi:hypothetical protein
VAVNVDDAPLHIEAGDAVTVTDGEGATVTVTVAVLVQPLAVAPVTV